MAGFAITHEVVSINGPFLNKPQKLGLVTVPEAPDGHMFFQCVTTNPVMKQLLVDNRFIPIFDTRAKALRKTSILGTLQKMKNNKWQNHVDRLFIREKQTRYTIPATKAKVLSFPRFTDIDAPKTMTVDSITVTVCLSKPGEGLVMRLTPEVLQYLRAVVTEQLELGGCSTIARPRPSMGGVDRVNTGVPNLFWSYRKGKYRARHHPVTGDDGQTPRRMEFLTKSRRRALLFIETGDRGKPSDDEDRSLPDPSEAGDEDVAEDTDEAEDEDMAEVVQPLRKRPSRCSATP